MSALFRGRRVSECTAAWFPVLERILAENGMAPRHLTVYEGTPRVPLSAATHPNPHVGRDGEH